MPNDTTTAGAVKTNRKGAGGRKIPQLRLHPNGQWYVPRRVHGRRKNFYFGKDRELAQQRYLRALPDLLAGRQPVGADPSQVSVLELTDRFIVAQEERFRAGDIGIREFDDLRRAALFFRAWAGEQMLVERMPPLDGLRTLLKRDRKLSSFNRYVTKIKKMLRWGYRLKPRALLATALHEDEALTKAKNKHVKRERRATEDQHGKPIYSPMECRVQLLAAHASGNFELFAFILLGLNAGMGQSHIADLPMKKFDLVNLYVDWVRPKTEELFQFTIWPITAAVVAKTIERRPKPAEAAFAPLLFLTRFGHPWVREYFEDGAGGKIGEVSPNDEIGKAHRKLEETLSVTELRDGVETVRPMKRQLRAFYALRRTFATIANDTKDKDAVRRIQGQDLTGMDPHYVRDIPVDRIRAVTDYVHRALFNCDPTALNLENFVTSLTAIDQPDDDNPAGGEAA